MNKHFVQALQFFTTRITFFLSLKTRPANHGLRVLKMFKCLTFKWIWKVFFFVVIVLWGKVSFKYFCELFICDTISGKCVCVWAFLAHGDRKHWECVYRVSFVADTWKINVTFVFLEKSFHSFSVIKKVRQGRCL